MHTGFLLPRGPGRTPASPRRSDRPASVPTPAAHRVTVRLAEPGDRAAIERLAGLDSARVPEGMLLVAELSGSIQAAAPVAGGRPIANPFVPTAEVLKLLELRAEQLRAAGVEQRANVVSLPRRPRLGVQGLRI